MSPRTKKILALSISLPILGLGLLYFFAVAGSKLGSFSNDYDGYRVYFQLLEIQEQQKVHLAIHEVYLAAPWTPSDPTQPFTPNEPDGPFRELYLLPEHKVGQYKVDVSADGQSFVAYGRLNEASWKVGPKGEPVEIEE